MFLRRSITGLSQLGLYAEKTLVKINEDGVPAEFYIAKHDYEPDLNGAGGILVVRNDSCADQIAFGNSKNAYADGTLDTWCNETYFRRLDPNLRAKILLTKFYYTPGNGDTDVTTLERKVFHLSLTELGRSADYANVEGTALPIANILQSAHFDSSTVLQWTRTPKRDVTNAVYCMRASGTVTAATPKTAFNARPAFVLPSDTFVDDDMLII